MKRFLPVLFLIFGLTVVSFTKKVSPLYDFNVGISNTTFKMPAPPPPGTSYYTLAPGGDMASMIWSNTSHVGTNCNCTPDICNPDFDIPANAVIYIAHPVTINCNIVIGSNATIIIESGGTLTVTGNGSVTGTGNFQVDAGGSVDITGDLNLSGTGDVTLNGDIYVQGDLTVSGGATFCGGGSVQIDGVVTGIPDPCFTGFLPIQLLSFTADYNKDKVELLWTTASEINNDYFTIERSKDGELWAEIIRVDGAGNSNGIIEYFDFDYHPLKGTSYYRIKQTDNDGKFSYSQTVVVHSDGFADFTTFPNPNDGNSFNLEFGGFGDEDVLVIVRDISGRQFYSHIHAVNKNHTLIAVDLDDRLASGTYIVTASSDEFLVSRKMVVK